MRSRQPTAPSKVSMIQRQLGVAALMRKFAGSELCGNCEKYQTMHCKYSHKEIAMHSSTCNAYEYNMDAVDELNKHIADLEEQLVIAKMEDR